MASMHQYRHSSTSRSRGALYLSLCFQTRFNQSVNHFWSYTASRPFLSCQCSRVLFMIDTSLHGSQHGCQRWEFVCSPWSDQCDSTPNWHIIVDRHHATEDLILAKPRKYYHGKIFTQYGTYSENAGGLLTRNTVIGNYDPLSVHRNSILYTIPAIPTSLSWTHRLVKERSWRNSLSRRDV